MDSLKWTTKGMMHVHMNSKMVKNQFERRTLLGSLALVGDVETDREKLTQESLEPLYKVIIHNDDVTPFDFVIMVLRRFFQLSPPDAEYVTYVAHTTGQALVATLPLKEAQKRVGQAHFAASLEGYPLLFTIEPE